MIALKDVSAMTGGEMTPYKTIPTCTAMLRDVDGRTALVLLMHSKPSPDYLVQSVEEAAFALTHGAPDECIAAGLIVERKTAADVWSATWCNCPELMRGVPQETQAGLFSEAQP